jgi:hypothetical protein
MRSCDARAGVTGHEAARRCAMMVVKPYLTNAPCRWPKRASSRRTHGAGVVKNKNTEARIFCLTDLAFSCAAVNRGTHGVAHVCRP